MHPAIFSAGGAIGNQVAGELSQEEATVFLSGRRLDPMKKHSVQQKNLSTSANLNTCVIGLK
jgi:NADP-dependent 3-hydroxy acid dehydrogenase YdfG